MITPKTLNMNNLKSQQGLQLKHLSNENTLDTREYTGENQKSALSPQEVAVKIWDQWMHCRLLSVQINSPFELNNVAKSKTEIRKANIK